MTATWLTYDEAVKIRTDSIRRANLQREQSTYFWLLYESFQHESFINTIKKAIWLIKHKFEVKKLIKLISDCVRTPKRMFAKDREKFTKLQNKNKFLTFGEKYIKRKKKFAGRNVRGFIFQNFETFKT